MSRYFRPHIREINSRFSFTSTGAYVDSSTHDGQGPPVFRSCGMNYHRIGSLFPNSGDRPRFAQLYMYDTDHETYNRIMSFGDGMYTEYDRMIIDGLIQVFNEHNELVRFFRMARDRLNDSTMPPVRIRLLSSRRRDRRYDLPVSNEVAGLFDGIDEEGGNYRDILVYPWNSEPRTIDFFHPKRCALHFPLFLVYGEDHYHLEISNYTEDGQLIPIGTITPREFYAYQLQQRRNVHSLILLGGRLFHEYVIDAYCVVLESRFSWLRRNKDRFRAEILCGLQDAVNRGDTDGSLYGRRTILPSSFVGGPRYMMQSYQDSMAICRVMGYPDLFITFTCNPKWPEIRHFLELIPGQPAEDRPDIIDRVFMMKLQNFRDDLTKHKHFGRVVAGTIH